MDSWLPFVVIAHLGLHQPVIWERLQQQPKSPELLFQRHNRDHCFRNLIGGAALNCKGNNLAGTSFRLLTSFLLNSTCTLCGFHWVYSWTSCSMSWVPEQKPMIPPVNPRPSWMSSM